MTVRAYVALGSNLGDPLATVQAAFGALRTLPDTVLVVASSLFRSAPVDLKNQPDFINAVAALDTRLAAEALLEELFAIEARFGRRRDFRHAPRTLDLDLILFGSEGIREAGLVVPHPRFRERLFVLEPLAEVAPGWVDPETGLTVSALLQRARATPS